MRARVVLTTGGTGGHIFPALAVAEQLRREGAELLFLGSRFGPEADLAAKAGIPFEGLSVRGVLGRGFAAVGAAAGLLAAVAPACRALSRFRPDVVAGFGAYASVAPLLAARVLGIPTVLHEQNAVPGLANRLLGKTAARIFLSLASAERFFPDGRCVVTGNPVREAIAKLSTPRSTEKRARHLLVMGGSQGAKAVNSVVLANLVRLRAAGVDIWHQSGPRDFERVRAGYGAHGFDVTGVTPFIDDVAAAYAWADLVLCRSGATSVAELAAAGKAAVLIPFPHATHDHQTHNARALVQAGAACLVPESEIGARDVGGLLLDLLADEPRLREMSRAALSVARPEAAATVARGILGLAAARQGKRAGKERTPSDHEQSLTKK